MESRPIPIEELKSGEFYDIRRTYERPRFLRALLLERLPNNRAKLMLMSSSDFDNFTSPEAPLILAEKSLQIEVMQLGTLYPYLTFSNLPNEILQWPNNYEGGELICEIKEEMRRAVSEGCWTFHLPHFCEGYLQVYLSYLCWNENYLNRGELIDLWFEFMGSFFSVLRDHILRVKLLSTENIIGLLKAVKGMDQMSKMTLEIRKGTEIYSCIEQSLKLADRKKSFYDSYRPMELSAAKFDILWNLIVQQYLIAWQLQEPLSLRCLYLNPDKLIEIISRYRDLARDLMNVDIPGLDSEEIIKVKFRIAVAAQLLHLPYDLIEHSGISSEVSSPIIIEEVLTEPILTIKRETLQELGLTRAEMIPSVLVYFNSVLRETIHLPSLLNCVNVRIAVEDWQFITFLIEHKSLEFVEIRKQIDTEDMSNQIKELIRVSLEHLMSAELLRDLLPCVTYGHLVFPALTEVFPLPHCREVMITYLRAKQKCIYRSRSFSCKMYSNICKFLTSTIALEDWELVDLVIQNSGLSPASWKDGILDEDQIHEDVKELVSVALDHKMSAELLEGLLPCVNYGYLIFPALAERFSLPNCRQLMLAYFKPEQWRYNVSNPRSQDRLITFVKLLTSRIALEDWEFVNFLIQNDSLRPATWIDTLESQKLEEQMKELLGVALGHKMNTSLLRHLLPCVEYGHFVFPVMADMFSLPHCREMMITYLRTKQKCYACIHFTLQTCSSILRFLTATITLEDWELIDLVIPHYSLSPGSWKDGILDKDQIHEDVKELVSVAVEHKMSVKLLEGLLPCVTYGNFVFTALVEVFSLPNSKQMMVDYFKPDIDKPRPEDRLFNFFKIMTTRIALEDWEFVLFMIENRLRPTVQHFVLEHQMLYEHLKELLGVALEHKMSAELLRDLLPCVDYGHLVFPTMADRFHLPNCREVIITYFRPELWHFDIKNSKAKDRLRCFLRCLTTRIAFEDWKFIEFVVENDTLSPATEHAFLDNKRVSENVKELINATLEHKMSAELLGDLLPCVQYGRLVFPAMADRFELPYCKEVMVTYFRTELWRYDYSNLRLRDRLVNFFQCLAARIALKEWEFVAFVTDYCLLPAIKDCDIHIQFIHPYLESIFSSAIKYKMSENLLKKLLPYGDYGEFIFPAFVKALPGTLCRQMMISYFGSEPRCIYIAQNMLQTQKPQKSRKGSVLGSQVLSNSVKDQKLHLWYVFGASVEMQFIWVRQFARSSINRLSPGLAREVSGYLV